MEVTAAAPLIETTSASGGRVTDNKQLVELPFVVEAFRAPVACPPPGSKDGGKQRSG
jgi:hypothetical protein